MTTLPSFVELMATLGLDPATKAPENPSPSPSPSPSPPSSAESSPRLSIFTTAPSPIRAKSSPALRDAGSSRSRAARYSPYSSGLSHTSRGSFSSLSPTSSDYDQSSIRAYSTSPRPSSPRVRRRNNLTVHVYGSSSDLSANTPISTYVRRKTPGTSPISPTFNREAIYEDRSDSPMPFTLPTLPPLFFPRSSSSDSFPLTPNSDLDSDLNSPVVATTKPLPDILEVGPYYTRRHRRYNTGVRISTPPRSADLGDHRRGHSIQIA